MTVSGRRQARLQDQIRMEVAEMIELELKDPRIGFATVTQVDLRPDLRSAHVRVSVAGEKEAHEGTLEGLRSATGYLRHELSLRLRLRRVPELVFVLDHSAEDMHRIESLLDQANKGS
ncbi:MAG TPA: 30S ribosome-binding factor RbfA [Terriglobia bacterium]|nr:30S ribosome-binding factor RbfA [Terriglobia bacterium]